MEQWKDIPGYEGLYQVSDLGRIKSLARLTEQKPGVFQKRKERVLVLKCDTKGYQHIKLCNQKNRILVRVHRLVANAFIPNPDNLPEVNHKDFDKTNNKLENLEWSNKSYNLKYNYKHGRTIHPGHMRGRFNEKNPSSIRIAQHTISGELVKIWPSMNEAERQGFDQPSITHCCKGKRKSHKGFTWRYAA